MANLSRAVTLFSLFFVASAFAQTETNQIQVINDGVAAFEKRLTMIEKAQTQIDIEYFIYNLDQSGRIFTQALIEKKQHNPNVKIRLLLDKGPFIIQVTPEVAKKLLQAGIEVRYYNSVPLIDLVKANYRDHRKLMLIDGESGLEALTGGRNIADEYFNLNKSYNENDRDIWVAGPILSEIQDSFERYWASDFSEAATLDGNKNSDQEQEQDHLAQALAQDFVTPNSQDELIENQIHEIGAPLLNDPSSQGSCSSMSYVTDDPGFDPGQNAQSPKRKVLEFLMSRMLALDPGETLLIESPYFIADGDGMLDLLGSFSTKNISATLLTNSLSSTDEAETAASFMPMVSYYEKISGMSIYVYSGARLSDWSVIKDSAGTDITQKAKLGLHAKTFVFGSHSFAIGTFNVDPRSENINNEMLLVCNDAPELAKYVSESISKEIAVSRLLDSPKTGENQSAFFVDADFWQKLNYAFWLLPSLLIKFLL